MEIHNSSCKTFDKNRSLSSCSFSNFSKTCASDESSNKEEFFTFSEPNSTRKFCPEIIILYDEIKKKVKRGTINRADCIRKRIKTHFNQYLLKKINNKISTVFPSLSLGKLSQKFVADVKIESNKYFIDMPIQLVFQKDFKSSKNLCENKAVINTIFESNSQELIEFMSMSYGSFFNEYVNSDDYLNDLKKFHRKEGNEYAQLYKKYSIELINYYKNGIPYKRKGSTSN
jgi:hypothetical protein